jgi:hypothetical protein
MPNATDQAVGSGMQRGQRGTNRQGSRQEARGTGLGSSSAAMKLCKHHNVAFTDTDGTTPDVWDKCYCSLSASMHQRPSNSDHRTHRLAGIHV